MLFSPDDHIKTVEAVVHLISTVFCILPNALDILPMIFHTNQPKLVSVAIILIMIIPLSEE